MATTTRISETITATTTYTLLAGGRFIGNVTGDGIFEYWDGAAYVAYADSGPGFFFNAPASGMIRVSKVGSGDSIVTVQREA